MSIEAKIGSWEQLWDSVSEVSEGQWVATFKVSGDTIKATLDFQTIPGSVLATFYFNEEYMDENHFDDLEAQCPYKLFSIFQEN